MPIKGSCHCGQTQFEVSEAPAGVTRCTCSLCAKRGALWAYYTPAQFRLTSPPENVATYRWGNFRDTSDVLINRRWRDEILFAELSFEKTTLQMIFRAIPLDTAREYGEDQRTHNAQSTSPQTWVSPIGASVPVC